MKNRTTNRNKKETDMLPKITKNHTTAKTENSSNNHTTNAINNQNNLYPSDILGLFKRLGIE